MSKNPVVIIPGIGQSVLFVEDNNGNKIKKAWPVEIDEKALLADMKSSLMKMLLFRKDSGLSDKIAGLADALTDVFTKTPDGDNKYNIKPVKVVNSLAECSTDEKNYILKNVPIQEFAEKVGEDRIYYFAYNFFGDAEETAKELDSFIASVKEKSGCDKVDLFVYSIGGAILKAYLKEYSVKCDCEKIVNFSSALDGASIVADIYENKLNIENAMSMISAMMGNSSVASMAGMIPVDVIQNIADKTIAVIKKNILEKSTTLWALIPDGRFVAAFSAQTVNDVFTKKVRALNEYSGTFSDEAKRLAQNGMKFYQICGSGQKIPEIFGSSGIESDGLLDVSSASFGNIFPDTTWYFDGQDHIEAMYNDVAMSLTAKIFAEDDISEYPLKNGSRNIKKLKNKLIPKVKTALETASGEEKSKLLECLEAYEKILAETVIENNNNIKQLEKIIEETV